MLADGAMAVHGTRRRKSVSWDYEGLLQLLGNLGRERTGLPLVRCYWYEATVEGRRTAEPESRVASRGITLRLAKRRPGRREGVETEIHRDLTVLARNRAVSDAVVVSAEEDLSQVLSDVQDLGMRVTIVHVSVDGNWTISRSLRQECDDIMELTSAHLRPFAELIPGAEPSRADEQYAAATLVRSASNGHSAGVGSYQALPAAGHPGPPSIYTAPVVAEYQRPAQLSPQQPEEPRPQPRDEPAAPPVPPLVFGRSEAPVAPERPEPSRPDPVRGDASRSDTLRPDSIRPDSMRPDSMRTDLRGRGDRGRETGIAPLPSAGRGDLNSGRPDLNAARGDLGRSDLGRGDLGRSDLGRSDLGRSDLDRGDLGRSDLADSDNGARQDVYGAPVAMPFRAAPSGPPSPDDPSTRNDVGRGRAMPPNDPAPRNEAP